MELFKNFQKDFSELQSSIKMWETATEVEIYKSKKLGWINLSVTQLDGNPLLTYYNLKEKRGIRLIQILSSENSENNFAFWIDNFGDENTFHGYELVFSITATELNVERYKKILSIWLKDQNTKIEDLKEYM